MSSLFCPQSGASLFTFEHSKTAYRLDFVVLGAACAGLTAALAVAAPPALRSECVTLAVLGLMSWTLVEYGLHRFILHGVRPFSTWHAEHHRRPAARIQSPTLLTVGFIAVAIYLPAWLTLGPWPACALTLGVTAGDFAYSVTHHVVHHPSLSRRGLGRQRRWHGLHHASALDGTAKPGYYGVTSAFWDHIFRTALAGRAQPIRRCRGAGASTQSIPRRVRSAAAAPD
jgi:sterol desaturase/sphingolipid hydroxylase (fatty acid hydroxylase superfamily)